MSVSENLKEILGSIENAAAHVRRAADDVTLVAVSKKQPQARIMEALAAGQRVFGENRVQEAQAHWADIRADGAYPDLRLHLIGPLQTNKVKDAVALFDVIETLDREKLARKLADEMGKQNRHLPCYIQVNTGDEAQKAGISVRDVPDFLEFCRVECGLDIQGLMCIPPIDEPAGLHFSLLAKYGQSLDLDVLSMGMSSDYEMAIAAGATHIRLGTAIFGARDDA